MPSDMWELWKLRTRGLTADSELELDIVEVLQQDHPVIWLVEQAHFSDKALETFTDILMHSDTNEETKQTFLYGAVSGILLLFASFIFRLTGLNSCLSFQCQHTFCRLVNLQKTKSAPRKHFLDYICH